MFPKTDLIVKMDRMRSLQILLNLISNSLKFSKEGDKVSLICDYKIDQQDF